LQDAEEIYVRSWTESSQSWPYENRLFCGPLHKGSERFVIDLKYLLFGWKSIEVEVKEIIKPMEENVAGAVFVYNAKPS